MDNNGQMPPLQPMQGIPTVGGGGVNVGGMNGAGAGRLYTAEQVEKMMAPKKDIDGLIKTIIIIILSLIAATFVGLFVWMFVQYNTAQETIDKQISDAVSKAVDDQRDESSKICENEKKNPYVQFAGPIDYGGLEFYHPKTWSVYIAADASNGGDFSAYLNPGQVDDISNKASLYALRVTIRDKSFDDVAAEYKKHMEKKDSNLNMETTTVNGTMANRYTGTIPGTDFNGIVVIFKIRDKTAILQTDSVLFEQEFNDIISSINFNA